MYEQSTVQQIRRELVRILKRATNVREPVAAPSGAALDSEALQALRQLARHLAQHPRFEDHDESELFRVIAAGIATYQESGGAKRLATADAILGQLGSDPTDARVYVGLRDVAAPVDVDTGLAIVTSADRRPALASHLDEHRAIIIPATSYCEVAEHGHSPRRIAERARAQARLAVALLRQELRATQPALRDEQLQFDLDGTAVCQLADGRWFSHREFGDTYSVELPATPPAITQLRNVGPKIKGLAGETRARALTALQWLEVAARPYGWRVGVPAIFAAMESLLVRERHIGDKAAVLVVRAVIIQVTVEGRFSDPARVIEGYELRSDLVHGTPTDEISDSSATDYLKWARRWGFSVFSEFVEYAGTTGRQHRDLMRILDESDVVVSVLDWFRNAEADAIVDAYTEALGGRAKKNQG